LPTNSILTKGEKFMTNHKAAYAVLADTLTAQGVDVEAVKAALKRQGM